MNCFWQRFKRCHNIKRLLSYEKPKGIPIVTIKALKMLSGKVYEFLSEVRTPCVFFRMIQVKIGCLISQTFLFIKSSIHITHKSRFFIYFIRFESKNCQTKHRLKNLKSIKRSSIINQLFVLMLVLN